MKLVPTEHIPGRCAKHDVSAAPTCPEKAELN